jgi:signal peptidase I
MSVKTEVQTSTAEEFWEILKVVVQALAIAFVVRIFLFQPFTIPSSSMEGTLLVGDYVFVSKFSYGFSKYSFGIPTFFWNEILPLNFSGRILPGGPKQGDVIVFRKPADPKIDYIKRLVGMPGDEMQMQDGVLYINGKAVPKEQIADHVEYDVQGNAHAVPQFQETLPNGVKYHVLDRNPHAELDNTVAVKVPAGHYFMMGDNRDNSSDSRDPTGGVGFVPFENLVGKAQIVFFSYNENGYLLRPWTWPTGIRWSRLFGFLT